MRTEYADNKRDPNFTLRFGEHAEEVGPVSQVRPRVREADTDTDTDTDTDGDGDGDGVNDGDEVARAEAVYATHGLATSGYAKTVGMLLRNISRAQATGVLTASPAVPMLGTGALAVLAAGLVGLGAAFARRGQRR